MTWVLVPTFVFNCVLAEKFISRDYPVANSAVEKPLDASWDVTTMCWGWAFVFRKTRIKTKLGSLRSWVTCAAADGVNKGEGSSLFLRWFPRHLLPASSLALSSKSHNATLSCIRRDVMVRSLYFMPELMSTSSLYLYRVANGVPFAYMEKAKSQILSL